MNGRELLGGRKVLSFDQVSSFPAIMLPTRFRSCISATRLISLCDLLQGPLFRSLIIDLYNARKSVLRCNLETL